MRLARSPEDHLELNAFGGRVSEIPSWATAFPHRDALFWAHFQAHWKSQTEASLSIGWVTDFYNAMKPYLSGAYVNAPDIDLEYPLVEYYGRNLPRLIQIKRKYDKNNAFRYAQSIPV